MKFKTMFGVLSVMACGACSKSGPAAPAPLDKAAAGGVPMVREVRFDFEGAADGALPAGFAAERSGEGPPGRWEIGHANDAPSGKHVLAQVDADPTDFRFPVCIEQSLRARDGRVGVRFKTISGKVDQVGGLVLRCRDKDNYYVARANALEGNVRFYKFVAGARKQIAGKDIPVAPARWHALAIDASGNHFQVYLDGQLLFEADDATFPDAGLAGLWTKADSVTWFDDLTIGSRDPR